MKIAARLTAYAGLILVGLVCAELFLRLIISPSLFESLWFTGKIHTQDPTTGFVFSPSYDGWMRHHDKVYLKKLDLDENGFRNSYGRVETKNEILLLGGYSVVFSYGLQDSLSLQATIGRNLNKPWRVHNTAWPGFNLYSNFSIYKKLLDKQVHPAVTVISFYDDNLARFAAMPARLDSGTWDPPGTDELFYLSDDVVVNRPSGFFQDLLGTYYLKSLVLFGMTNQLDLTTNKVKNKLKNSFLERTSTTDEPRDRTERGKSTFVSYVSFLNNYFRDRGSKVLFVFLPIGHRERTYYQPLISMMPDDCTFVDLHDELFEPIHHHEFIGLTHYSSAQSEIVGSAVAREISRLEP